MSRHILVVDDNGDVRDVIVDMLASAGFVATAVSGGEAMRDALAAGRASVDAILLDALMPGEPSTGLALHAKELKLPVVMMSGSRDTMKFADDNGLQLLPKPFRLADLIAAIESALASGRFGQRDVPL
jgi:two-component system, NtrC family, nitrogen regulation response regulator NtrX